MENWKLEIKNFKFWYVILIFKFKLRNFNLIPQKHGIEKNTEIKTNSTKMGNYFLCVSIFRASVVSLCILCFLAGCQVENAGKKTSIEEIIPVRVVEVKLSNIRNTLDYVGDIKGEDEALVYPKVAGKIVEKLKEEGSFVEKGEVIAYIDRDEVGFTYEKAPVESSLRGTIGRIYVDKGVNVSPQTPVALVVDMDNVKIGINIPEKYLSKISLQNLAEITVDAFPGEKFIGRISQISPVVDIETRTFPVQIFILNNQRRLSSGMFARVKLILEEHKDMPVIPKEAVLGSIPNGYIYVVLGNNDKNDGIVQKRIVKLGLFYDNYFEVIEGVNEGDFVVVMGQQKLRNGSKVSVEKEETE